MVFDQSNVLCVGFLYLFKGIAFVFDQSNVLCLSLFFSPNRVFIIGACFAELRTSLSHDRPGGQKGGVLAETDDTSPGCRFFEKVIMLFCFVCIDSDSCGTQSNFFVSAKPLFSNFLSCGCLSSVYLVLYLFKVDSDSFCF